MKIEVLSLEFYVYSRLGVEVGILCSIKAMEVDRVVEIHWEGPGSM